MSLKKIQLVVTFLLILIWSFLCLKVEASSVLDNMQEYLPENLPWAVDHSFEENQASNITARVVGSIIDIIIYISGTLAVIGVIVGGARYMFSFGGEGKEQAKSTLIWSLLGLVAVMLSYAIVHNVIRIILEVSVDPSAVS